MMISFSHDILRGMQKEIRFGTMGSNPSVYTTKRPVLIVEELCVALSSPGFHNV
jgi:hypothetical protein